MALYRLKLSDGTTTINLWDGTDSIVREGGLSMPPPRVKANYTSSPFADGAELGAASYDNRTIGITLKIWGSSLADLKTNIRSLMRLLNDAEKRTVSGHGAQVYLEYQWGDTDTQSTYFDVLRGDLAMPDNYLSAQLTNSFYVVDARLTLICRPFGRYTNQTIVQATLENSQSGYYVTDSYTSGDDTSGPFSNTAWRAQSFTPASDVDVTHVAIKLILNAGGDNGDIVLGIYATDVSGHPTGAALATKTIDSAVMDDTQTDWLVFELDSPLSLTGSTKYAIVCYRSGGSFNPNWRYDNADGSYAGGERLTSVDSGATWAADAGSDYLFAIFAAESGNANYQDISTSESYGDVPAKLYLKLGQTGATGTEKVWVAKRSGTRQTDDLWIEGEDASSITDIASPTHFGNYATYASGGSGEMAEVISTTGAISTSAQIARFNYTLATVPKGHFRVLARVKVITEDAADYDHIGFGYGWSYGNKTYAPPSASSYYTVSANNAYEILDLGELNLPPVSESDIATNASFELRIFTYSKDAINVNEYYSAYIDYIFLLPIDEGAVIIGSVASTDTIAVDGLHNPPGVFFIDGSDIITDYPDCTGRPFTLGREDTRIYVLRDDVPRTVTFASDITYQPQFLLI